MPCVVCLAMIDILLKNVLGGKMDETIAWGDKSTKSSKGWLYG